MVHSVELVFDPDTDAAVRQIWDDLAAAGVRSQAAHTSASNRPHLTLAVAEQLDDGVNGALSQTVQRLPLDCCVGAPMLFGAGSFVLVRLVVPSTELLSLHAEVHRIGLAHARRGLLAHACPGQWTPHVTLARRVPASQLATAMTVDGLGREIWGTAVGLRHWDGDSKTEYPIS